MSKRKKIKHIEKKINLVIEKVTTKDREEKKIKLMKLKATKGDLWEVKWREKKLVKEEPENLRGINQLVKKGENIAEMSWKKRKRIEQEKKMEQEKREKLRGAVKKKKQYI